PALRSARHSRQPRSSQGRNRESQTTPVIPGLPRDKALVGTAGEDKNSPAGGREGQRGQGLGQGCSVAAKDTRPEGSGEPGQRRPGIRATRRQGGKAK